MRYNLGGLRAPFTIDVDQRNLANGQPHSFNMSRDDRTVTIQVGETGPRSSGLELVVLRIHASCRFPRGARGLAHIPQALLLLPHKAGPGSPCVICILVPQCPVVPTAVLSSATINRLPAEGPSAAAESALIRVCVCFSLMLFMFPFIRDDISVRFLVLSMSLLPAQPCSRRVGQGIHLLPAAQNNEINK